MSESLIGYADFVKLVIEALEALGIEYLIGGAVAAWAWGEPRSTMDLDLVANVLPESAVVLSQELEKRNMLVPADIIMDTIMEDKEDIPISAIHLYSGFKADIYLLRPLDELRHNALARRQVVDYGPPIGKIYVHSPEDLILYKVWFFSLSHQTKHIRDIAAIMKSQGDKIDFQYLATWMERKGLQSIWKELLNILDDSKKNE
jgi:hypothetical protein